MGENGGDLMCHASECPNKLDNKNTGNCLICRLPFHHTVICAGVKSKCNFVCRSCANVVSSSRNGPGFPQRDNFDISSTLLQLVVKVTEVLTKNSELHDMVRELKDCNRSLIKRIETLEEKSGDWSTGQKHLSAPPCDVNALTSSVTDELIERQGKELNLVVMGLSECNTPVNGTEVSEEDEKRQVTDLLQSIQVNNPSITRVFRMGRRSEGRPRPIKVFCENKATRSNILTNAKKLSKLPEGHRNRKVFIRPDLTKLQRNQDFVRRQEARQQPHNGRTMNPNRQSSDHSDIREGTTNVTGNRVPTHSR